LDITGEVQKAIDESKIKTGILTVFAKHTTAGFLINENDQTLLDDIKQTLRKLIPEKSDYKHSGNSFSHQWQMFAPPSRTIPVENKKLALGAWQSLFLIELDEGGSRKRQVNITILGK
jgi:secondary thiamine-phosphate synthase enzyme